MSTADLPLSEGGQRARLIADDPATAKELKLMIKDWRTGRATRSLGQALSDGYIAVFGFLLVGAMIVNVIIQAQGVVSECSTQACLSARELLPWATFALCVAAALVLSRLFGPVLASAAEGFWLLDAPVQRNRLLWPRLVGITSAGLVIGTAAGALISALTGSHLNEIVIWGLGTGLASAAAISFAAAEQGAERHLPTRLFSYLFGLVGLAALLAVIAVAARWATLGVNPARSIEIGFALIAASAIVLVLSALLAQLRLSRIRRTRLLSGGALVSGISGAFFALDFGLIRDIVVDRRAMEIGHVRSKHGRGIGLTPLIWREAQRLARSPQPLLWVALSLVVPYAVDALGMGSVMPIFAALVLFGAMVPMLNGLRVLTRTGGLARSMPFSSKAIKRAVVAVPAVIALIWTVAAVPAFLGFEGQQHNLSTALMMALVTGAAGFLGAVRWTTGKPPNFGGPAVASQFGAIPPGLIIGLIRGFDMCLLITAPLLLGMSPVVSLVIAAIVAIVLLTLDWDAMKASAEEQQKQLNAERQRRAGN
ncbi:MAG: ABC transporter permease [Microlunatus sp.]|nr:ABC transporter permease [Microlunatus sp.]